MNLKKYFCILLMILNSSISQSENEIKIENPIAKKVLQTYQALDTYHVIWMMDSPDPNSNDKFMWQVAFDRPTKRVLFSTWAQNEITEKQRQSQVNILFVADGEMMQFAMISGKEIQETSVAIDDTQGLSYRDIRRAIPFLYPFDLPLIYSENHYMEVVQGAIKEIKTVSKESDKYLSFEVFPMYGETSAQFWVNPNTMLIQKFTYNHPSLNPKPTFKIKSLRVNKPLGETLFNYKKQLIQIRGKKN